MFDKTIFIFGCGNILFGDDGFGPAVIKNLQANYALPEEVLALDVGTGIRDLLFNLAFSDHKPRLLIIVDAVEYPDRQPGEIFEIEVDGIPLKKTADFSLHQFPTVNFLKELKDHTQIEIKILVAQTKEVPEEVKPGLSPAVEQAVPQVCARLWSEIQAAAKAT